MSFLVRSSADPCGRQPVLPPPLRAQRDRCNVGAKNGEFAVLPAGVAFPINARSENGRDSAPLPSAVRMAVGYSQPARCNRRIYVTLHVLSAISLLKPCQLHYPLRNCTTMMRSSVQFAPGISKNTDRCLSATPNSFKSGLPSKSGCLIWFRRLSTRLSCGLIGIWMNSSRARHSKHGCGPLLGILSGPNCKNLHASTSTERTILSIDCGWIALPQAKNAPMDRK